MIDGETFTRAHEDGEIGAMAIANVAGSSCTASRPSKRIDSAIVEEENQQGQQRD